MIFILGMVPEQACQVAQDRASQGEAAQEGREGVEKKGGASEEGEGRVGEKTEGGRGTTRGG